MKAKRSWTRIGDLVDDARETARVLLGAKPVAFAVDCRLQGLSVLTDPFALRAVLRTLIANAAKHTASGAVTLRITGDSYAVRFAVHDSGAGVDTRVQRDLLRPGRVFDACLVRRLGHPDLGLPLSHHLAHLLGGELMLRSTPGSGSVFTLAIPAVDGFGNQLVQRLHPGFSGLGSRTLAA